MLEDILIMTDPPDSFIWYGNPRSLTISYSGLNSKFGDILNSVIGLVCNKVQTVYTAQALRSLGTDSFCNLLS